MTDWLFYVLASSTLLALAARAAEEVAGLYARPVRWVWVFALFGSCALPVLAAASGAPLERTGATADGGTGVAGTAPFPVTVAVGEGGLAVGVEGRGLALAPEVERLLVRGWLACSAVVLLVFAAGSVRLGRSRRRWRDSRLCGVRVLVSRRSGPAVLGVLKPAIVVPDWLLTSAARVRRMVVLHEGEHVRAHDSRLLALACVAVAAAPWNPVLWWMLVRLRAAIEVDCDRRVLCRGADPGAYGGMLLGAARRASRLSFAVALKQPPSLIERRILAMTRIRPRFRSGRAVALASAAAVCTIGAYALKAPAPLAALDTMSPMVTGAPQEATQEVTVMLPAAAARELRDAGSLLLPGLGLRVRAGPGVRVVEGTPAAGAEPLMIVDDLIVGSGYFAPGDVLVLDPQSRIASVDVIKGGSDVALVGRAIVRIHTRPSPAERPTQAERPRAERAVVVRPEPSGAKAAPIYVVDGVVQARGVEADVIDASQIERVEVIKGAEAVRRYGERAASGVVLITTKRAGGEKPVALVETPRRAEPALTVTPLTRPAPLYVVDGVVVPSTEASSIEGVVPRERIRSISVLKGAQAVSLYGARAAGGVISIATVPATPVIREVPARAAAAPAERVIAVPPAIIEALRTEGGIPFEVKGGRVLLRVGVGVRLEAGSPPADANDAIVVVDGVIVGLTSQRGGNALSVLDGLRMEDVESVEVVKRGTAETARWGWSFVFVTTRAGR